MLYRMTGNRLPPQIPAVGENRREPDARQDRNQATEPASLDGLEALFARAGRQVPGWTTISARLSVTRPDTLTLSMDRGNGGRPDLRSQLTLETATGALLRWESFSSYNRGRQLRSWARFTHTGEAGGLAGQTLAALASAAASLLVLTGLSLARRRFAGWQGRKAARQLPEEPLSVRP
jgi:uncharacterized iron-regulated membrane protein